MTDTKTTDPKKKISLSGGGKPGGKGLSLRSVKSAPAGGGTRQAGTGGAAKEQVRQDFSGGRSKSVDVEHRGAGGKRPSERSGGGPLADGGAAARRAAEGKPSQGRARVSQQPRTLTEAERVQRQRILAQAKQADAEREAQEAARLAAEEERRRQAAADAAAAEQRVKEAEAQRAAEERNRPLSAEELRARELAEMRAIEEQHAQAAAAESARLDEQAKKRAAEEAAASESSDHEPRRPAGGAAPSPAGRAAAMAEEEEGSRRGGKGGPAGAKKGAAKPTRNDRGGGDRRRGKLTVVEALSSDDGENSRGRSQASLRRQRERQRLQQEQRSQEKIVREVVVPEVITVQELANRMAERVGAVVKTLMTMGVMATATQSIDADTAEVVVTEFGHKLKRVADSDVEEGLSGSEDKDEDLQPRPPVVTVMGHVDHGKTSLLDALRETDVVKGESGGITQHIGAYQVTLASGQHITFIDTPGHEAFTEMRSRGANTTDIVILVVAADDGVMPQTIEAIKHAKAAEVPMIVAINKSDLPAADPTRVQTELLQYEVVVEDMSGDVQSLPVSAKTRQGLDSLEEAILLQAELLELKANPDRAAEGTVVEAKIDQGRGSVATVLVQRGTLKVGDIFVSGAEWGRVRALVNDKGKQVKSAGPSSPVEVLGLQGAPLAGDDFVVVEDEARAREISEYRQDKRREKSQVANARGSLEQLLAKAKEGDKKTLPVVLKGDVQGSVEAISASLEKLVEDHAEVQVKVMHGAVGGINESDLTLAKATDAMVIGFNVRANPQAREMARRENLEIRYYSVIYDVIDDVKAALSGLLSPVRKETFIGNAEIREVFNITKVGKVAGCYIVDGVVKRGAGVRLLRDNVVIHEGRLKTLKRFKEEVRDVREGYECGMAFENYDNIAAGDIIECYEIEEVAQQL